MQISENFKLSEFEYSNTGIRYGVENKINGDESVIANLTALVTNVMQPLRDKINKPINITSGYRCPKLNKLVGGVENSQHLLGQACDFKINGMRPYDIAKEILDLGVVFDQLILYPNFVHVSYNEQRNRKRVIYNSSYRGKRF